MQNKVFAPKAFTFLFVYPNRASLSKQKEKKAMEAFA